MRGSEIDDMLNAANDAVDKAGTGELRGLKLIRRLLELGVDLVFMETPKVTATSNTAPVQSHLISGGVGALPQNAEDARLFND